MKIQHLDVRFQLHIDRQVFIIDGRRMVLCIQVSDVTRQKVEKNSQRHYPYDRPQENKEDASKTLLLQSRR